MKVYARQIEPDYQESPLTLGDENLPDNIAVFGNKYYAEHMPDFVENVWEVLRQGKLAEIFIEGWHNEYEEMNDYLPPENREPYTVDEVSTLKKYVLDYADCPRFENLDILCKVLSIVTGQRWDYQMITGCCQRDWNYLLYPVEEWSAESIRAFEAEYFNTGSEWSVHYDEEMEGCNYNIYCHSCEYEEIKKEIADAEGIEPENVTLYAFDGWTRSASYKKV